MKTSIASALLLTSALTAPAFAESLTRVATVPLGGEITGMFQQGDDLFFNVQHPADDIGTAFAKATVGVIANADFAAGELAVPEGDEMKVVKSTLGAYQVLVQEGDFGKIGHIAGAGGEIKVSNDPDFNAYVATGDAEGYLFTNWEDRPGGMSRVKLMRAADGTYSVDEADAMMIDFSAVQGTWVNCFGTLSPWSTPLTSEELYFDDTADWNNPDYKYIDGVEDLAAYVGAWPNPYRYGYIVEITDPAGSATPVKHFSMGRYSHENSVVMPDDKTVYLSDDGTNVVFYKFVADAAGDLSAGTLYAAKMTQSAESGADAATTGFDVEWIELASGNNAEIEGWIAEYDGITTDDYMADATAYISDEDVAAWAAGEAADNRVAFLESRKAASAKGATAEFRKMEGVNINYAAAKDGSVPFMYMAMSEVAKGMSDAEGDIQVSEVKCGVVYEFPLEADYNTTKMVPVVAGGAYDKNAEANACNVDAISNPDNLLVLSNGDVLIGEDTGAHENNAMWLWSKGAM
ncbi:alkaline phosphatase PhoX [Aliiruegeria sabulilitoris]|uniref:alkaline phosphatase PhoX n=1 Tax=Aliiruegeria sabulilitoris TaxID=1510458 RepID=UPI000835AF5B|nr:alkaline phosphatase PhoX [Aliiruegeria sabulilitoris]